MARREANGDVVYLREMVKIWHSLARAAKGHHGTPKGYAYSTAQDVIQNFIEDQPGGREFFWDMMRE